ncbi:SDR family oxidoreductase [Myceligenerans indicum]|uniref:SDR family oxidoreductase n=1 Tax=Myceligenerans indicum TaxID=2593663 RepID=A0ABS1LR02_9MICO|nr:SDR family oxidoreductase [Myceligenerans indicum]MBL0888630.1 SDR family oxidoreductase [Myceligenerans indicum]
MELNGATALVTGANRGLGRHLATQLLDRGAAVYAAVRHPDALDLPGVTALRLDVTDDASIHAAAKIAADTTVLINNAGISTYTPLGTGDMGSIDREIDTNFYGPLRVTRAFAPVIAANGGGAILNVLSVVSWMHPAQAGGYAAAKAAAWALTDATREELAPQRITVSGLHVGLMDTDMTAGMGEVPKADPADVAAQALDGIASGASEILADDLTRQVRQGLAYGPIPTQVA